MYFIVAVVLIATDVSYMNWRGRSLEPLSSPIDLTRPRVYTYMVRGFHARVITLSSI